MAADLRDLAQARLSEAETLLTNGQPAGAFYLAGYAIECGLKACIARSFAQYVMPDKTLVTKAYTHSLEELIGLANLNADLRLEQHKDPAFAANWRTVLDWNEATRYEFYSTQDASDLIDAIKDPSHGVLQWISTRW